MMNKDIYNVLDEYIDYMGRKGSNNTVKNYELHIIKMIDWMIDNNIINRNDFDISQKDCLDYIKHLEIQYAPSTVHTHMSAVFSFLTFIHRRGYIHSTPFIDSSELNEFLPPIKKKDVRALTKEQLKIILDNVSGDIFKESLIRFFYDTAARVSEVVKARWDDINEVNGRHVITIFGKGRRGMSKKRKVLITNKTFSLLEEMKRGRDFESEYIFCSDLTKKPYSTRRIDQIIKEVAGESGIKHITTHSFRKSIATHLIEKGMDIEYVSEYLGHANIETTRNNYADLSNKVHDKFEKHFEVL